MSKSIETQAKTIEAAIEEALSQLKASYDEVDVDIIQEAGFLKKAKIRVTLKATEKKPEPMPAQKKEEAKKEEIKQEVKHTKSEANISLRQAPNAASGEHETKQSQQPLSEKQKPAKKEEKKGDKQETKHNEKYEDINKDELPKKFEKTYTFTEKLLELLDNQGEVTYEITEKSFNINVNGTGAGQIIGKGGEVLNAIQTIISAIAIVHSGGENKRVYFNVEDYKERRTETLKALALRKADKVKETGRFIKLEPMNARDRAIIHSALEKVEGIRTYSTGKDPHRCLCIAPKKND